MARKLSFMELEKEKKFFGGRHLGRMASCHAKDSRPVSLRQAMHVVLKAQKARGPWSFLKKENAREIRRIVDRQAKSHGIKVYRFENVGNHLHLLVQASQRSGFLNFLRCVPGLISRIVVGNQKGNPGLGRLWDQRPFTRVVNFGRDFGSMTSYLDKNGPQALGFEGRDRRDLQILFSG